MKEISSSVTKDQTACSVSVQPTKTWTSSSQDTPLSPASSTTDYRQKVQFTTATGDPRYMEILYGTTGSASSVSLTKRNAPTSTPNIQYPDGPGLRVVNGWAFITFQWPLLWMDSIDAGSIGTTAVMRNRTDQADVYLIANKLDIPNPDTPQKPAACTDPEAHLYVLAKGTSGACMAIPSGYQALRRRYELVRDASGKITKVTFVESKSLHVQKTSSGSIEVPDDAFLQKVLDCAALQGLYSIP